MRSQPRCVLERGRHGCSAQMQFLVSTFTSVHVFEPNGHCTHPATMTVAICHGQQRNAIDWSIPPWRGFTLRVSPGHCNVDTHDAHDACVDMRWLLQLIGVNFMPARIWATGPSLAILSLGRPPNARRCLSACRAMASRLFAAPGGNSPRIGDVKGWPLMIVYYIYLSECRPARDDGVLFLVIQALSARNGGVLHLFMQVASGQGWFVYVVGHPRSLAVGV